MTELIFDHERLDVYRFAIEYVASSYRIAKSLNGPERHARAAPLMRSVSPRKQTVRET